MITFSDFYEGELTTTKAREAFLEAAVSGVKELELTKEELLNFARAFGDMIPAECRVAQGDFYFWGIRIVKYKDAL